MPHGQALTAASTVRFDADERFVAPQLASLAGRPVTASDRNLRIDTAYYDTEDAALAGRRLALSRRTADGTTGWRLKLPSRRRPLEFAAGSDPTSVPPQMSALLTGFVGDESLRVMATVRAQRLTRTYTDDHDAVRAEVVDDVVTATSPGRTAAITTWREVRVRVPGDGARPHRVRREIHDALIGHGATPSPKRPADVRRRDNRYEGSGDAAVLSYLQAQADAIATGDVDLRRGVDGVHRTRVAVRRLRSVLRVFTAVLDDTAQHLETELGWFQHVLGEVRDREVQRDRFRSALAELDATIVLGPVTADLDAVVLHDLLMAQDRLREAMDSPRYRTMQRDLTDWLSGAPVSGISRATVERLAEAARRRARKRVRRARGPHADDAHGDDVLMHRSRKAIKRARYAAELATALDPSWKKHVRRCTRAQDLLGEHQDAVLAASVLRRAGAATATLADRNGFTYGVLYQRERDRADRIARRCRAVRL